MVIAGCGSSAPRHGEGVTGRALADALVAAAKAAASEVAPWRCATMSAAAPVPPSPSMTLAVPGAAWEWTVSGDTLRGSGKTRPLVMGVIADARGTSAETLAAIASARAKFAAASVDLVVSLGGLGEDEAAVGAALGALLEGTRWPVVAIPADREALPAHRRAIAALAGRGLPVVDGAVVRFVDVDGAILATVPGMPTIEQLAAGSDGCVRDRGDLDAVLTEASRRASVDKRKRARVLLTPVAPRQGPGGSDLAPGGVHAGELALAAALAEHPVDVIVHGQVDGPGRGGVAARGQTAVLPAPAIDATPRFDDVGARVSPAALVVRIDATQVAWQVVAASAKPGG